MASNGSEELERVLRRIEESGLLLLTDARLPSVAAVVAGSPIRGSWWAHPRAREIYDLVQRLREHPDVLLAKLLCGKLTYVHRSCFGPFLAVARSGEPWQVRGLSRTACALLRRVQKDGAVRSDRLPKLLGSTLQPLGEAARELERRLLLHSYDVHTERGSHAKQLESWDHWLARTGEAPPQLEPADAKLAIGERVAALAEGVSWRKLLPWDDEGAA